MIKFVIALMVLFNMAWPVCTKISMPTDYSVVTNGSRANLKANFDETQTKVNPCMDSVDEVRARFTGYTGSFGVYSLENLLLRLDTDASTSAKLVVQNSNGDSLFRVSEDSSARVFGAFRAGGAVTLSNYTSGQVPYFGTAGLLTSGTGLTYNGSAFSVTGTGAISGDFAINTNKFNITASTGNFSSAGTATITSNLSAGGDFAINTNKFNVTAATGNFSNAGTASISGNTTVGGNLGLTGRLNINGATDANNFSVNSAAGHIAASGTWGFQCYGIGVPGASNAEFLYLNHNGATPFISVDKLGTGSYRNLEIKTGGSTAITVATNQAVTLASTLSVTGASTLTGAVTHGAGFIDKTTSLTSNTTLTTAHSTIFASASGGSFTITLPAASGNTGLTYTIYKTDVSAAATGGGNTVTIDGNASETIGGALTQVLASNTGNGTLRIICDGSNWQVQQLYDEGTFTGTLTGCTTSPTGTLYYGRTNKNVTINLSTAINATSNSTSMTITGMPSSLSPSRQSTTSCAVYDNSIRIQGTVLISGGSTTIEFGALVNNVGGFTSSGTKGFGTSGYTFSYNIQ